MCYDNPERPPVEPQVKGPQSRRLHYLMSMSLVVITLAAYLPLRSAGFINCDDPTYVTGNAHVQSGLTLQGIRWAMTSFYACNWHPLTWMSHMLDWEACSGRTRWAITS